MIVFSKKNFPDKNFNSSKIDRIVKMKKEKKNLFSFNKSQHVIPIATIFYEARISEYKTTARPFSKYNNRSIPRRISYQKVINIFQGKNLFEKS